MKALFITREFPPYVYGGAGVHVEYLSKELAKLMDIDVRCLGDQDETNGNNTTLLVTQSPFSWGTSQYVRSYKVKKNITKKN